MKIRFAWPATACLLLVTWTYGTVLAQQSRSPIRGTRPPAPAIRANSLFQLSTLDALAQGVYEGSMPLGDLKHYGDFGLGTFDALNGEMVVLDGVVYQVTSDGVVHRPAGDVLIPFISVTHFNPDPDTSFTIDQSLDMSQFTGLVEQQKLPSPNYFYAFRVAGTFRSVKARSVPKQYPPYQPLSEVIPNQAVFPMADVDGTAVCLWTPQFAAGINAGGMHCHFISDDRSRGGHALDFVIDNVTVEMSTLRQQITVLPDQEAFQQVPLPAAP